MPCSNTMRGGALPCLADDSEEVCDDLVLSGLDGSKSLEHHRQRRACTRGDHTLCAMARQRGTASAIERQPTDALSGRPTPIGRAQHLTVTSS